MYKIIEATVSVTRDQVGRAQVQCGYALQSAGFGCEGYFDSSLRFTFEGREYGSQYLYPFGHEALLVLTDELPNASNFRFVAFTFTRQADSGEWVLAGDIVALTQDEWDEILDEEVRGDLKLLELTTSKQK